MSIKKAVLTIGILPLILFGMICISSCSANIKNAENSSDEVKSTDTYKSTDNMKSNLKLEEVKGMESVKNTSGITSGSILDYPDIKIKEEKNGTYVYWNDNLIVELKENRYLRFRSTFEDENWVGSERKGADLCWAYADPYATGFEVIKAENEQELGTFTIKINGKKPKFDSSILLYLQRGIHFVGESLLKPITYRDVNTSLVLW